MDDDDNGLARLFETSRIPDPGPIDVINARTKLMARLRAAPKRSDARASFVRRAAFGGLASVGLWASTVGTAFAHKAGVLVAGASLIVGAGVVAETTGAGPALREATGINDALHRITEAREAPAGPRPSQVEDEAPGEVEMVAVEEVPEGYEGNLIVQMHPTGRFTARAIVTGINPLRLRVAGGGIVVPTLADDAVVHLPGPPSDISREESVAQLLDRLVFVEGVCDAGAVTLADLGCAVTRITALGRTPPPVANPSTDSPADSPARPERNAGAEARGADAEDDRVPDHAPGKPDSKPDNQGSR